MAAGLSAMVRLRLRHDLAPAWSEDGCDARMMDADIERDPRLLAEGVARGHIDRKLFGSEHEDVRIEPDGAVILLAQDLARELEPGQIGDRPFVVVHARRVFGATRSKSHHRRTCSRGPTAGSKPGRCRDRDASRRVRLAYEMIAERPSSCSRARTSSTFVEMKKGRPCRRRRPASRRAVQRCRAQGPPSLYREAWRWWECWGHRPARRVSVVG
jgi:hypothetical protein